MISFTTQFFEHTRFQHAARTLRGYMPSNYSFVVYTYKGKKDRTKVKENFSPSSFYKYEKECFGRWGTIELAKKKKKIKKSDFLY